MQEQKNQMPPFTVWLLLARVPFLISVIGPVLVGTIIAAKTAHVFNPVICWWAVLAAALIHVATNMSGEAYDIQEDTISMQTGKATAFSGGSQMVIRKHATEKTVTQVVNSIMLFAIAIGLLLQFYYKTGPWTIPLGVTGLFFGYFYSKPPLRFVKRGIGEVLIGYSFGWLSVAVGFYLQTGFLIPLIHWVSIPIACTIFNVILLNEFPDYPADKQTGKKNLLVRIGKQGGAMVYILAAVIGHCVYFMSLGKGLPFAAGIAYIPVVFISCFVCFLLLKKSYESHALIEKMCGLTILVNIGTSLALIIGFLFLR